MRRAVWALLLCSWWSGLAWADPSPTPTQTPYNAPANGATPGDATDDTTAFRAAVSAIPTPGGGILFVPDGTYLLTKSGENAAVKILIPNVTIQGESKAGAILKFVDTTTDTGMIGIATDGASPNGNNFTLKDITLDGNGANWGASGSHIGLFRGTQGTADNGLVTNVLFKDFANATITTSDAIRLAASWNDWTIENSTFTGNRRGIDLLCPSTGTSCAGVVVTGNTFDQVGAPSIGVGDFNIQAVSGAGTADGKFTDITIDHNTCSGTCGGRCIVVSSASTVLIDHNDATGCLADQIIVSQLTGVTTTHDVTLTNNTAVGGADGGMGLETAAGQAGVHTATITDNSASRNASTGLFLVTTSDVLVAGNTFDSNGVGDLAGADSGIYITGEAATFTASRNTISGNHFTDTNGPPTQKYGIQIPAVLVDATVIQGNTYSDQTVANLNIANSVLVTNTTLQDTGGVVFTDLGAGLSRAANGSQVTCTDCTTGNPCAGSGGGATARRLAGAWRCDAVTAGSSGPLKSALLLPAWLRSLP